jgi:hypothetical protein
MAAEEIAFIGFKRDTAGSAGFWLERLRGPHPLGVLWIVFILQELSAIFAYRFDFIGVREMRGSIRTFAFFEFAKLRIELGTEQQGSMGRGVEVADGRDITHDSAKISFVNN